MKFLILVSFLIHWVGCTPPKTTNSQVIPYMYYSFSKPQNQVLITLDSIISYNNSFFKEETDEPRHFLINYKGRIDTITYVIYYKPEEIKPKDSTILFVMNINKHINRKSDETPLYPKMDSSQKAVYLKILDSLIITPLRKQLK